MKNKENCPVYELVLAAKRAGWQDENILWEKMVEMKNYCDEEVKINETN